MDTKNKVILTKLAKIIENQQKIINKLSQQVFDQSKQTGDPLGKLVHDAALAWQTKAKLSAKTVFDAGVDGKHYDVNVTLTITDPKKPVGNTPAALKAREMYKTSFTAMLQSMFDTEAKNSASELFGSTATFNVTVV